MPTPSFPHLIVPECTFFPEAHRDFNHVMWRAPERASIQSRPSSQCIAFSSLPIHSEQLSITVKADQRLSFPGLAPWASQSPMPNDVPNAIVDESSACKTAVSKRSCPIPLLSSRRVWWKSESCAIGDSGKSNAFETKPTATT